MQEAYLGETLNTSCQGLIGDRIPTFGRSGKPVVQLDPCDNY